ncbi:ABC transporter sub-family G-like protein 2 [Sarcoptes scabiei]|uniref:ABC transporter sub-family G-like protein 2 n=1 Tax=Sarcoptes scabiei TaxID=52283 RepID=A0A131ZUX0_SARSC|nr:ABC transporter sub-family G-like protein 2 [Sarcoptes scabiei]
MNNFIGNGNGFRNGGAIGAGAGAGGGGEGGGGLLNENIYHHHKDSNHSGNHQQPIHHPITSPNFHSNPNQNHLEPDDHGSPFNDTDIENDADDSVGNLDEPFVMPDNNLHSTTLPPPLAKHPHLVVKDLMYEVDKSSSWRRLCGLSRHKLRILEDISFDVHGGELMAIMATSEMSTRQALLFAGLLIGPASRSTTDVKRFTRTLLEELNLGEVRHTKLSELTYSERKRLHIAIHLLLDTELLMIDQPLLGLDIFDSFFLIEYLRQWAIVGGRAVIMTVSPPNFEIFTMIHKVLLMSAGRSLYVGHRKDMIKYFSSIGYPCPPYKNPSDYYLDLITLDDLSQEALIESSQRIETLAEIQNRRSIMEIFSSMPGPPSVLPAPFRRANLAMQFLALWIRALIFGFPYNAINLFGRFIITLLLSLMIGAIFWQVRGGREQEFVWDRIGFINTMLSIGIVPILIFELINGML